MGRNAGPDFHIPPQLAHLHIQRRKIHSPQSARRRHLQIWQLLGVEVPVGFGDIRVDRHRIGAGHKRLLHGHVFKISARGPVAQQNAVAVHQSERRQHEVGQVHQALVNLLVQPVALPAQNAVPVFHAQSGARKLMMLGDGQVEDLVGFEKRREDGPALQHHAAHVHLAEMLGIGQNDLGALGARRRLNA